MAVMRESRADLDAAVADAVPARADSDAEFSVPGDTDASGDEGFTNGEALDAELDALDARDALDALDAPQPKSAPRNSDPEVGNVGLFFGNWGQRATMAAGRRHRVHARADRQIKRAPGSIICMAEATVEVELGLRAPAVAAAAGAEGLDARTQHEHFCIRGSEVTSVLIACRKDVTTGLECLLFDVNEDHPYREKKKAKIARTKTIIGKATFKQNIGHIGKDIVVAAVHLNCRTARVLWKDAWDNFWNMLASQILKFGVQFLTGDFNMSLTEVTKQLRSRGIVIDCVAWYPWRLRESADIRALGFDSCGIFYIGGSVKVSLQYDLGDMTMLTSAVAEDLHLLHVYDMNNAPGQAHCSYQPKEKSLAEKLTSLLTPTDTEQSLAAIEGRPGKNYCRYLRLKQKPLRQEDWLTDGEPHNGAHFPLAVFTNNSSSRSAERAEERFARSKKCKGKGKGKKRMVLRSRRKRVVHRSRGTPPMRGVLPAATRLQAITRQECPQTVNEHRTMAVTGATGAGTAGVPQSRKHRSRGRPGHGTLECDKSRRRHSDAYARVRIIE